MAFNFLSTRSPRMSSYFQSDNKRREVELLSVHQMPELMKAPYIFTGYRPVGQPWKYYFSSFLTLHNESINVWTHVGGFCLLFLRLCQYLGKFNDYNKMVWPVLCYGFCCLANLAVSSAAHLLHSKSVWYHYVLFLVDYMGVTLFCFGSGVASMYVTASKQYFDYMRSFFLPINVTLALVSFYTCCLAKFHLTHQHTKRKVLMMAGVAVHGIFVATPMLSRYLVCMTKPECTLASLNHLTFFLALTVMCAMSFGVHVPESLLPGTFDVIGHGHQIFHTLAVLSMMSMVTVMDIDIHETRTGDYLEPSFAHIFTSLTTLVVLQVTTLLVYVRRLVLRCIARDSSPGESALLESISHESTSKLNESSCADLPLEDNTESKKQLRM